MKKALGMLFIGSLVIAIGIVFGFKKIAARGKNMLVANLHPPVAIPSPVPPPVPQEAAGLKWARLAISGTDEERKQARQSLTLEEKPQPEVMAFLESSMSSKSVLLPVYAALAPKNPEAVPLIIAMLPDATVKKETIETLGQLGPLAVSSVPALRKIYTDKQEPKSIRAAAAAALVHVTPPVQKKKLSKPTKSTKKPKTQKIKKKKKKS